MDFQRDEHAGKIRSLAAPRSARPHEALLTHLRGSPWCESLHLCLRYVDVDARDVSDG